jgi:hypothetical protein
MASSANPSARSNILFPVQGVAETKPEGLATSKCFPLLHRYQTSPAPRHLHARMHRRGSCYRWACRRFATFRTCKRPQLPIGVEAEACCSAPKDDRMPRPRTRACLQDGLKLDLNRLARNGFILRGARSGPIGIRWYSTYWDKEIASGLITANMSGTQEGWLRLQLGDIDDWFGLIARPRHFGGRQWYFMCLLPGRSGSRQALGEPPPTR